MIEQICKNCGKIFYVYPYRIKRGNVKFCSISCGTFYRNKVNNPALRPEVRKKISENHADVSGKNNPMYGRKGELAPSYIDGRSKYQCDVWRRIAIIYIEHRCTICGCDDLNKLDVHHRDGNRKNNELCNLYFLCKKCHLNKAHKFLRGNNGRFTGSILNNDVFSNLST
jgi:5-methylcytosine-specific restriction endonuclease McrA